MGKDLRDDPQNILDEPGGPCTASQEEEERKNAATCSDL